MFRKFFFVYSILFLVISLSLSLQTDHYYKYVNDFSHIGEQRFSLEGENLWKIENGVLICKTGHCLLRQHWNTPGYYGTAGITLFVSALPSDQAVFTWSVFSQDFVFDLNKETVTKQFKGKSIESFPLTLPKNIENSLRLVSTASNTTLIINANNIITFRPITNFQKHRSELRLEYLGPETFVDNLYYSSKDPILVLNNRMIIHDPWDNTYFNQIKNDTIISLEKQIKWNNHLQDADSVFWTFRRRLIIPETFYSSHQYKTNQTVWVSATMPQREIGAFGFGDRKTVKVVNHQLRVVWISDDDIDVIEIPSHVYDAGFDQYGVSIKATIQQIEYGDFYIYYGNRNKIESRLSLKESGASTIFAKSFYEENLLPEIIEFKLGRIPLIIISLLLIGSILSFVYVVITGILSKISAIFKPSKHIKSFMAVIGALLVLIAMGLIVVFTPFLYMPKLSGGIGGGWAVYMIYDGDIMFENLKSLHPSLVHIKYIFFLLVFGALVQAALNAKKIKNEDALMASVASSMLGLSLFPIGLIFILSPITIAGAIVNFSGLKLFYSTLFSLSALWSVVLVNFSSQALEGLSTGKSSQHSKIGFVFFIYFLARLIYELAEQYMFLHMRIDLNEITLNVLSSQTSIPSEVGPFIVSSQLTVFVLVLNLFYLIYENRSLFTNVSLLGVLMFISFVILPMGYEKAIFELIISMAYIGFWFLGYGTSVSFPVIDEKNVS